MPILEFGEYLPDLPPHMNPGATEAKNVLPFHSSYKQFPGLATFSDALDARCQGAIHGRESDEEVHTFAGDAAKLYEIDSSAEWQDVSVAGGYSVGADEMWSFTQWGDQILATQINDPIQTFTMGTSTLFANLAGSPPQARQIAVVRDFVVVGDTWDGVDGFKTQRVRWCGIGDPTSWTISATTQADAQDLSGPNGTVKKIIGGEYGTIIQERAITRMTYVGSPAVFQFDTIEEGRGTPASGSVVKLGRNIFYLGDDGFYVFDGVKSTPLSHNKVSRTFYDDLDTSYYHRISAALDPQNQIIMWAYPGIGNISGNPNKIICFNYSENAKYRWSYAEISLQLLVTLAVSTAYTLDSLDSVSTDIDALAYSLDSRQWRGNIINLSAFNTSNQMATFAGTALDAVIETGESQFIEHQRARVNKAKPIVDGGSTVTVQVGERNLLSSSVDWQDAQTLNSIGEANIRSNAFYHRFRLNLTGGFTHAQGVDVRDIYPGGSR